MADLTARQERFVLEYLVDFNGTQAAIRSGYSAKTARQIATENLSKPDIQAALAHAQARQRERLEIDSDAVVTELARVAFSRMVDVASWDSDGVYMIPSDELDHDVHAAVKDIRLTKTTVTRKNGDEEVTERFTINLHDKLAALDKLSRHLGIYNDSVRIDLTNLDAAALVQEYGLSQESAEWAVHEAQRIVSASEGDPGP